MNENKEFYIFLVNDRIVDKRFIRKAEVRDIKRKLKRALNTDHIDVFKYAS